MRASNDVLVVGAWPAGLMAAGELAGAGVRCTIVEKRAEESDRTRAFAVHVPEFVRTFPQRLLSVGLRRPTLYRRWGSTVSVCRPGRILAP